MAGHAESMTMTMHFVKETPGTILFAESLRKDGKNRNLYVPKPDYVALGEPSSIRVTIEAA